MRRALPFVLVAVAIALLVAAEVLTVAGRSGDHSSSPFIWAIAVVFGTTGTLISRRQPANPIGWIFLAAALSAGLGAVCGSYADYVVATGDGPVLPARIAAQYSELSWMPFMLLPATFLLALFPDGHLLSRRWRPVGWCAGIGLAGGFVAGFLVPGPTHDHPQLTNPFGLDHPVVDPLNGLALLLVAVGMVGSSVSLVLRLRRSAGVERLQIRWLALAGVVAVITLVIGTAGYEALGEGPANVMMMAAVLGLPAAAGVAILRYRLYDIDLVINRALVYGSLTALLALIYLGSVLVAQLVLEGVTEGSGLAVAASTLATAALVRPARARIQAAVDRRFFRRKYDAARTLDRFGTRLRDHLDLGTLQDELGAVVAETMQPAHVSLWIPAATEVHR